MYESINVILGNGFSDPFSTFNMDVLQIKVSRYFQSDHPSKFSDMILTWLGTVVQLDYTLHPNAARLPQLMAYSECPTPTVLL